MMRLDAFARYLSRQSGLSLTIFGFALSLVTGIFDYLTGRDISLEPFYLLPIFMVALFAGWPAGLIIAVVSAVVASAVDAIQAGASFHLTVLFWNDVMTLGAFGVTARIGAVLKRALEHEQELARTDDVTGAANRRAFFEAARTEMDRARRYQHPFTVAYLDLDNFKQVNDRFGHSAGDGLLRLVAQVATRDIRANDVIARLGGDEFAVLLPETGGEAARAVMERIQKHLREAVQQTNWPVTFSIGVATFSAPPDNVDNMLRQADDLMYAAKQDGKNTLRHAVVGAPEM